MFGIKVVSYSVRGFVCVGLALCAACTGQIGGQDAKESSGGAGGNDERDGNGGGGAPVPATGGKTPSAPVAPMVPGQPVDDGVAGRLRRLNASEYRNTVRDLLGLADFNLGPVDAFLPDAHSGLFVNNLNLAAGVAIVENYAAAAESFAEERVRYHFDVLSKCDFGTMEESCAREFITRVGKRTFRRPLSEDDVADFLDLYRNTRTTGTYQDGVRVVLAALLQSHEFLYHFEVGESQQQGKTALTGYEIASRLSYMFWSSMPDDALFAAAEKGELGTTAGLQATSSACWPCHVHKTV